MARTKTSAPLDKDVVAVSDNGKEQATKPVEQISGANVVTVCSRLSRTREFVLNPETGESCLIRSANDSVRGGGGIPLKDGESILFTMERSKWEKLLALYGDAACFENGLVFECSKSEFEDKDRQAELSQLKTGFEAGNPQLPSVKS